MTITLVGALLYSALPPAVGVLAAWAIAAPAGQTVRANPQLRGQRLVLQTIPEVGVVFGIIAAVLASSPDVKSNLEWPLLVVGAAGATMAIIQGFVIRTGFPKLADKPAGFGKLLIRVVIPEILAIAGLVVFILQWLPAKT